MTGKVLVDSNVLVYAHDADAGPRQKLAAARIKVYGKTSCDASAQVLQEFYVTVIQKLVKPLKA